MKHGHVEFKPKNFTQLCNTRDTAPNGEVQTYYMNPDGTRGARKLTEAEENKEITDNMRSYWANLNGGSA